MKRIKVNAYQVGLVFKNDEYKRMLTTGTYWFWTNEVVWVYDITKPFYPTVPLDILLQDQALADILNIVEVKDGELVLVYQNGVLDQVLRTGRYAFWKSIIKYDFMKVDISKIEMDARIDRVTLSNPLLAPYVRSVSIENYESAVLFVDGKYQGVLESGVYYWWKNSITVNAVRIDIRNQQLEVNGQEILTKDKAAIRINAWAQYKLADIEKAILNNKEYDKQLYVAVQLALRQYIGNYTLDELLDKKESIGGFVVATVQEKAAELGVKLKEFGIRDIILPGDVREIMNQVLVAEKKAQANIIMRREETASTRSLLNTAKLMEENAMLWKLKEMEYVEKIAEKISNISVSGNGALVEQLKQIFIPAKSG